MTTALLFLTGSALALAIVLRNPGYAERYTWWPTWPEWAVQAFGVGLIGAGLLRVMFGVMVGA